MKLYVCLMFMHRCCVHTEPAEVTTSPLLCMFGIAAPGSCDDGTGQEGGHAADQPSDLSACALEIGDTAEHFKVSGARQGLVKVELGSKTLTVLTSRVDDADVHAPGTTIDYANDPDIAPDGKVYFSDSAHGVWPVRNRFGFFDTMQAYMLTMFQARRACGLLTGRLAYHTALLDWLLRLC